MDPEPLGPHPHSCLDLVIQHNKSMDHSGQLKHSCPLSLNIDIELNMNQILYRKGAKVQ